jgi:hypothetical protein
MKRIYGYGRRKGTGFRWQDGKNAAKRTDEPVVLQKEVFKSAPVATDTAEEIELKAANGLVKKPAPAPAPIVIEKTFFTPVNDDDGEAEELKTAAVGEDNDIGDLPPGLVGFMPTDNVQPVVSEPTPEEMVEPED